MLDKISVPRRGKAARATRPEIHKQNVRETLPVRNEPYWAIPLSKNQSIGFRKINAQSGSWIARLKEGGRCKYKALGDVSDSFGYYKARDAAETWFKNMAQGVKDTRSTVADACRAYVEDRRREKSEATANDAHRRFERTVYGDGGDKKPNAISAIELGKLQSEDVRKWRDALTRADGDDKGLSKASVNRTQIALNAALNMAVRHDRVGIERARAWLNVKPFAGNDAKQRRRLFLDLEQRRALLKAAKTDALRNLLEACMHTGCRAGELVNARCKQLDVRKNSLTVSGKTGTREVLLSPAAKKFFQARSLKRKDDDYLLVRADGKPWGHSDWDELVRDAAAAAKLPTGTCLYTLRHSWITEALMGGMPTLEVSKFAGTSVMMIEKHYGHLVDKQALERLSKVAMV